MSYGQFRYTELQNVPPFLKEELGLRAVHVPRQDGYREHYALLDGEESAVFECSSGSDGGLKVLAKEANRRRAEKV